ncbi:MAG: efflux RND transporter periplasmic adaptor subunit [Desulfobacterales bacterium]|nr:efflux RND transporter periplasmic adaptor subunit [Desulfobacterales bacterium]
MNKTLRLFLINLIFSFIFINYIQASSNSLVAVEVIKVKPANVTESIDVVGTLSPKSQVEVKAEYPAKVKEIYVNDWVYVKKGQKLANLDSEETEIFVTKAKASVEMAKADILKAKVALSRAEREYNRTLKLKQSGLATQQNLDEASTEKEAANAGLEIAQAQLKSAEGAMQEAKLRLNKMIIYAPIDGVIALRGVNVGDLTTDRILFKIVDNRLLDLTVTVPSKDMRSVIVGADLTFKTDAFYNQTFKGKIKYINPSVNESDRSVKVLAEVQNDPVVLKGGLFVQGKIITRVKNGVLEVNKNAFITWDIPNKKAEVFIVKEDTAKRISVQTGMINGDLVEITKGLSVDDLIVSHAGFNVKDGDKVKITEIK